ncbi:MAG TPA: TonB family protein [Candidatus Tumulicola sp.]|nr:TonB family protein [Candidatus Tumulicola sp.]
MSYLPDGSMRRSLKARRKDQPATKRRNTILGIVAIVVVVAAVAWGLFAQASSTAGSAGWHQVQADQKASVAMRIASVIHPIAPKPKPTPSAPTQSPTPSPTPTAKPTSTPTPAPQKTDAAALYAAAAAGAAAAYQKRIKKIAAALKASRKPATVALAGNTSTIDAGTNRNTVTPPVATPAPTPTPATEVYAPQVVVDARFVRQVQPEYPDLAREQNLSGTAIVLVTVGPKGNVLSTRVEKSAGGILDGAALAAARQSTFQPPKIDGKPATETYRIVYTFSQ